jgi:hypothetical protein
MGVVLAGKVGNGPGPPVAERGVAFWTIAPVQQAEQRHRMVVGGAFMHIHKIVTPLALVSIHGRDLPGPPLQHSWHLTCA